MSSHQSGQAVKLSISLPESDYHALARFVNLQARYGALNKQGSVEGLLQFVATSLAVGSENPSSWQRHLITLMGLAPENEEFIWEFDVFGGAQAPESSQESELPLRD